MASNNEYYKVSFITTHSGNLPNMVKHTGALVVMSDLSKSGNGRKSIWLHGDCISSGWGLSSKERMTSAEWLSYSYNKPFAPYNEEEKSGGMTYFIPEDNIEDVDRFVYDENNSLVGKPQTIKSWLSYGLNFTYGSYTWLCYSLEKANEAISNNNKETNSKFDSILGYLNSYTDKLDDKIDQEKINTYHYIDSSIERIVGGAPDYLDSLYEIKNFLEGNAYNATRTLDKLSDINSMTIKRENELKNGFVYIASNFTYTGVDKDNPIQGTYEYVKWSYNEATQTYTYSYVEGTYTYYGEKEYDLGPVAIESNQVNGGGMFGDFPLDKILDRLIQKYDYKKPELADNTVVFKNSIYEYNSTIDIPIVTISLLNNDASSISEVELVGDGITTQKVKYVNSSSNINSIVSIPNIVPEISSKNDIIESIMVEKLLSDTINIEYDDATIHNYPQFDDSEISIQDTKDAYKAGSITAKLVNPIKVKSSFKAYYGQCTDDENIPTSKDNLTKYSWKWIDSKESTGKMWIDGSTTKIWCALPSMLIDESEVYVESFSSGVKINATSLSTNSIVKSMTSEYDYNGIKYRTITITNLSFTSFADKSSLEVIFN